MSDVNRWRIKYMDGTEWANINGPPENAPAFGVLCVMQSEGTTPILQGRPFYVYDYIEDFWHNTDLIGMLGRLRLRPLKTVVKEGFEISDDAWKQFKNELRDSG